MHNFPPHLSSVATLRKIISETEYGHAAFLCEVKQGLRRCHERCDQLTTDEFIEISRTV